MMKGNSLFKWTPEGKQAFHHIKEAMANAPVLVCPDYSKEFILYSYVSDHTCSAILMQRNSEVVESPIAFMSYLLKTHELKYLEMEKHAFVMVKAVKHFRFYILNSHVIALVPDVVVKSILTQKEFGTKRGNCVAKIQEYDMEIKPTNLVHGKGCPAHLSRKEKRTLKLKVVNFVLWDNGLYKKGLDGNFLCCVDKQQELEETRAEVVDRITAHQSQVKALFDRKTTSRDFSIDGSPFSLPHSGEHLKLFTQKRVMIAVFPAVRTLKSELQVQVLKPELRFVLDCRLGFKTRTADYLCLQFRL
ncbi:uncharacterized protein LOC131858997 [Cryptomeria japonica]|uniref:uncharacterized protein LOC131858997 n=1 Tax=Cryptomeria japonica TaxID=3369 RepID=UPI0027DAB52A|nr:uncharacterized protein LOC131858997 [Cryptomeria japonica]